MKDTHGRDALATRPAREARGLSGTFASDGWRGGRTECKVRQLDLIALLTPATARKTRAGEREVPTERNCTARAPRGYSSSVSMMVHPPSSAAEMVMVAVCWSLPYSSKEKPSMVVGSAASCQPMSGIRSS